MRKAVGGLVKRAEGNGVDLAFGCELDRISEIGERAAPGFDRDRAGRNLGWIGIAEIDEDRPSRLFR